MAEMVRDSFLFAPNDVELQEEIGKGTYSRVFAAAYKNSSGQRCNAAAKKVRTSSMQHREIQTMQQLDHTNIIKFYGVYIVGEMDETYILMELAERKDLRCFLNGYRVEKPNPVRLPQGLVWKWVTEAASALEYLHALHQSHRDIKSLNYLVMSDFTLKLGDLGLTKKLFHTANTKGGGTCQWMAPEVISKQLRSPKSDVFSFGIVVWETVTTDIPFFSIKGDFKIMRAICDGKRPEIPDDCPSELRHLMQCCWEADYNKRPTMEEICAALKPCIAGKPVFSPADVNLEVKTTMGPPAASGTHGTNSLMMDLGTGSAIQDVHMMTQSPCASREQIDGGGDTLPGAASMPGPLTSHPSTSRSISHVSLGDQTPIQMPVQDTLAPGDSIDLGQHQQQLQQQQFQQQLQ
ncbi:serine/threonine-protein kinase Nek7-like, partial [Amphiura filiformis]|uniref:serine/threonine-protein kinase Nek7-like n=1 Tax=Amphiura filiformis TaxID=82378 RepID=UPI003B2205E6